MRKKIIGIILLVLIIFGGYKLFANVSANNVNSKSIRVIILMYMLMIISRILQVQRLKMNAI